MRIIDLFSGGGGLSEGVRQAVPASKVVAAVELDPEAAHTYRLNHEPEYQHVGDVWDWVNQGRVPKADLVIGGPPCQGFSKLGKQDPSDPRNLLWQAMVKVARLSGAHYMVMENVPQLQNSDQWLSLLAALYDDGWSVSYGVLNAADYNAATTRKRLILIASKNGVVSLPGASRSRRTVADTIGDLADIRTVDSRPGPGVHRVQDWHYAPRPTRLALERMIATPPEGNRSDLPDRLLPACLRGHNGHWDTLGRMRWNELAPTLRTEFQNPTKGRFTHPVQNRVITVWEGARIQGFPDHYLWVGNRAAVIRQIGNSVPIPLAYAVGVAVGKHAGFEVEKWPQPRVA